MSARPTSLLIATYSFSSRSAALSVKRGEHRARQYSRYLFRNSSSCSGTCSQAT